MNGGEEITIELTPDLLVRAYSAGIFPMADPETGTIEWYSPDPRGIIPLEDFHVPRTLARRIRRRPFRIEFDRDFEAVMRACGTAREDAEGTWIDERLVRAYVDLHGIGLAHSVEARREDDTLVGGLYGVHLGRAFFGESMFVRPDLGGTDASKICLVHLVEHLRSIGAVLLDTQFTTPHLERFGATTVPRPVYLEMLGRALEGDARWGG